MNISFVIMTVLGRKMALAEIEAAWAVFSKKKIASSNIMGVKTHWLSCTNFNI